MSFSKYTKYKACRVHWLGEVPEHWDVKRIRFVAQLNPSKSEISDMDTDTMVSFLPMEAIGEDGTINIECVRVIREVEVGYKYFREGDVALAKITPCFENGKGAIMGGLVGGIGFGTTELTVLRPRVGEVAVEYLNWLLISPIFRKLGEASMYGAGGQKRVPDDFVKDFAVGFPPISEQIQIAAFLNHEANKIDALMAAQELIVELLKEKRQAVISNTLIKGIEPNVWMKDSGVKWLGEIPRGWNITKLGRIVFMQEGPGLRTWQFTDDGTRVICVTNITEDGIDFTKLEKFISTEEYQASYKHFTVQRGDILLSSSGNSWGKIAAYDGTEEVILNTSTIRINEIEGAPISREYITLLLQSVAVREQLELAMTGSCQPNFGPSHLSSIVVAVPNRNEQATIVLYLCGEIDKLNNLIKEATRAMGLLKERRSAIISAAVTGKIDVRSFVESMEPSTSPEAA